MYLCTKPFFPFLLRTCCVFHHGSKRPVSENGTFQNCHFAHFHRTAAARADTRGYSGCIGIHRAPSRPRAPSAYRQRRPFSLSLTHSLKYQTEVTRPGLMLILTIMRKDGTLNIPRIIHHEGDARVPEAAGCLFIFMRLIQEPQKSTVRFQVLYRQDHHTWTHYHSYRDRRRVGSGLIKSEESYED